MKYPFGVHKAAIYTRQSSPNLARSSSLYLDKTTVSIGRGADNSGTESLKTSEATFSFSTSRLEQRKSRIDWGHRKYSREIQGK